MSASVRIDDRRPIRSNSGSSNRLRDYAHPPKITSNRFICPLMANGPSKTLKNRKANGTVKQAQIPLLELLDLNLKSNICLLGNVRKDNLRI